jgi:preprotein translocase subunit YajC
VGGAGIIIVFAVMFAVMWLLVIRPQKQRQRQHQATIDAVEPGDEVVSVGGIYGDVIEVMDDRIVLEIAEGVQIELSRRAIGSVVKASDREDADDEPAGDEEEPAATGGDNGVPAEDEARERGPAR